MFRHDVNECDLGHHQKSGISENSESKQQRELLQAASGLSSQKVAQSWLPSVVPVLTLQESVQ